MRFLISRKKRFWSLSRRDFWDIHARTGGTLCTPAVFWAFVDPFYSKFEHFVSFSELRRHSLTGLSKSNNSTCAGRLWPWRIQRRAKRWRVTFWSWSHHVWKSRVDKIKCFLSTFLLISNSISGQSRHHVFNRGEIGRIGSDFDVWPTIWCARIRASQRT